LAQAEQAQFTVREGLLPSATCPGPGCLLGCSGAVRGALGPGRLPGRGGASGSAAVRGSASRLFRQRSTRDGTARFALENPRYRTRDARPPFRLPFALAGFIGVFGTSPGLRLGFALLWRTERHAGASCLGQTDGNGLLRRPCAMLAAANLADFLVHEFAGLRGGRFPRAFILPGLCHRSSLWHDHSPKVVNSSPRDILLTLSLAKWSISKRCSIDRRAAKFRRSGDSQPFIDVPRSFVERPSDWRDLCLATRPPAPDS